MTTSWLAAATQTRASIIPVSPWVLRQMPFLPQPTRFPGLGLAQNAGTATSSSFRQSNCLHMDGVLLVFQAHLFGTACWIILETTHYPMIHSGAISKPTFCTLLINSRRLSALETLWLYALYKYFIVLYFLLYCGCISHKQHKYINYLHAIECKWLTHTIFLHGLQTSKKFSVLVFYYSFSLVCVVD